MDESENSVKSLNSSISQLREELVGSWVNSQWLTKEKEELEQQMTQADINCAKSELDEHELVHLQCELEDS